MKKKNILYGFTLIELLVVIAIIGLISSMMLVVLSGKVMAARDAKRRADMATVQTALEIYYSEKKGYPQGDPTYSCVQSPIHSRLVWVCAVTDDDWFLPNLGAYLTPNPPQDPGHHADARFNTYRYGSKVLDQAGREHSFVLFYMLEQGQQEDRCNMGQFVFPDTPLAKWSTRCPD